MKGILLVGLLISAGVLVFRGQADSSTIPQSIPVVWSDESQDAYVVTVMMPKASDQEDLATLLERFVRLPLASGRFVPAESGCYELAGMSGLKKSGVASAEFGDRQMVCALVFGEQATFFIQAWSRSLDNRNLIKEHAVVVGSPLVDGKRLVIELLPRLEARIQELRDELNQKSDEPGATDNPDSVGFQSEKSSPN